MIFRTRHLNTNSDNKDVPRQMDWMDKRFLVCFGAGCKLILSTEYDLLKRSRPQREKFIYFLSLPNLGVESRFVNVLVHGKGKN